ncbi:M1 family metallopeptidase, partial [Streptomyces celluloflavus]
VAPAPENVPDTATALLKFDGISYAKGASALRQLVAWMGEQDFLAGINDHFARHRFGNATLADFIDSLARHTDRDVHAWAANWLRTTGVDTLTPIVETGPDGWRLDVAHTGGRPHRIAVGLYDQDPADTRRLTLRDRFDLDLPADTGDTHGIFLTPAPDLVLLNDGDLTYTKIRFDPASWQTLTTTLATLPDSLSRAVAWNAARDLVRDGELPPAAYLDLARTHLPRESDLAIVQGVLTFARTQIADRYLPHTERHTALTTLHAISRDILRHTEGPAHGTHAGLRLTAVRAFIDSATRHEPLQEWLDDGTVPGGPALDPELRWRILGRLAVLGATPLDGLRATIDAELVRDPSAIGRQGAARCHAALPDPAAKQAAWDALFTTDDGEALSNYLFTATATGFWNPEQHDLLRPYAARYFSEVPALAAHRGPALAEAAGRYAFPATLVEDTTLTLGETCLADGDPTPALRRKLTDQLDDLRRALGIRAAHGTPPAV